MERAAAERKRKEAEAEAERLRKEEEEKMINRCFYKEYARTHTLPHTKPSQTL
jgi:hypothetical protein